jgi:hypothetical protein
MRYPRAARTGWLASLLLATLALSPASLAQQEPDAANGMIAVRGLVVDAEEQPVTGYWVVFRVADGADVSLSSPSDETGEYAVPLPAGQRYVVVAVISPGGTRLALDDQQPFQVSPGVRRDVVVDVSGVPAPMEQRWPFPGADRLFLSFVEDTSTVQRFRWESQFEVADQDAGTLMTARVLAAVQFYSMPQIEFGARLGYEGLDGSAGVPDGASLGDLDLWAKYHLGQKWLRNSEYSFGAVVTLPTGGEETGQSFDAARSKLFMAMRYYFSSIVVAASAGVRFNESGSWYGAPLDGKTAPTLAAAALYPLGTMFTIVGEFTYEGERFAGSGADTRLLAGVNWKPADFGTFRFSIAGGLSDGAPDSQVLAAWAFDF